MKALFETITLFAFCALLGSAGSVFGHETTGRVSSIRGLGNNETIHHHHPPPEGDSTAPPPEESAVGGEGDVSSSGGSRGGGGSSASGSSTTNDGSTGSGSSGGSGTEGSTAGATVDDSSSGQSSHAGIIGLATAAVVLGIGAASLARRGRKVEVKHPLTGSLGRRMSLFNNLAEHNATQRPPRRHEEDVYVQAPDIDAPDLIVE